MYAPRRCISAVIKCILLVLPPYRQTHFVLLTYDDLLLTLNNIALKPFTGLHFSQTQHLFLAGKF